MNNDRIWTLVAQRLAGEATAVDMLELHDLLKENPEIHYSLEIFDELWQQNRFAQYRPVAAYARLLKKLEQQGIEFPAGPRLPLQQRLHASPNRRHENLLTDKTYSVLGVTGLAIAIAVVILILL